MNQHNFTYPFTDAMSGVRYVGKTYLFQKNGIDFSIPEHIMEFLVSAAIKGNMAVECIKFLRTHYNVGLKEAKDVFDTIKRNVGSDPNAPF